MQYMTEHPSLHPENFLHIDNFYYTQMRYEIDGTAITCIGKFDKENYELFTKLFVTPAGPGRLIKQRNNL